MMTPQQVSVPPPATDAHHPPDGAQHTEAIHTGEAAKHVAEGAGGRFRPKATVVSILAVVLTGGYWIGKDVLANLTSRTSHVEPLPIAVPVKVKKNGQSVDKGYVIRVLNGPSYPLDDFGETTIDAQYRGDDYEVLDQSGKVVHTGMIPDTTRLNIELT